MKIENQFDVAAPIDEVWAFMLDVEKVAPCVPGGELTETVDDRTWKGKVAMKMGPVSLSFTGTVTIQERDDEAHRVVLRAEGREQRGKGAATAASTSRLEADGDSTKVFIETELTITGAVAQYGRGMIGDISQRLTKEFADCLQANITSGRRPAPPAAGEPAASGNPPAKDSGSGGNRGAPSEVRTARPVKGIRLGLWAMWRAIVRVFRRLFGRRG
jgi:carbon monoxide dehydrogenase subunit G